MNNSIKSVISTAKAVLVMLPNNPTFDQVASAASLYLALSTEQGKEVSLYSPSPMIVEFNRLIGVNKVKSELGNKNLSISFSNYDPQGIEKVSWDIDKGEFKLTIVPKAGVASPSSDQVIVGYAGVAADLVILVGGTNEADFAAITSEDLAKVSLAHIGVSQLNVTGRTVSEFATPGAALSEVTAKIIKDSGYNIEADIATNLLMGVEEATQEFSTSGVTADTFMLVSELMRAGGKRLSQGQVKAQDFPAGAIPGMPQNVPSSWTEPKIFKGTSVS